MAGMEIVVGASAEAVASLVSKLGSLLAEECMLIGGVREDIQFINDEFSSMQAFLVRLRRGTSSHDEQRHDWMKQVREVAYDIEDCVDNTSHNLRGEPHGSGCLVTLQRAWYFLSTLYTRHSIAIKIRNLKVRAQLVCERRSRYGVENPEMVGDPAPAKPSEDQAEPRLRLIGMKMPVGLDETLKDLDPQLFEGTHGQLMYLAVVGFAGLGKTTLAMALYDRFAERFDCKAVVLATQKFHLRAVLLKLVLNFQERFIPKYELEAFEQCDEDLLKRMLRARLQNRTYLVLIDDIWSISAWESIRDSLPKNGKGGTVIVTTRFKSVSEACRRVQGHVYEQKPLSDRNSYSLFLETLSSGGDDLAIPLNETMSSSIIMKTCGGLPLTIVLVAGLLASRLKSEPSSDIDQHLAQVGEDLSGKLGTNLTTEGVRSILSHCYNHLPADLKTCFLYLGMFPKGCTISRKSLIRKWISEGFITEKNGKTNEEVAEDCFNELVSRNLIRAVKNSRNGKVNCGVIHDMILEYIVSVSNDENFITVVGGHWHTPFPSYKVRRLSVHKTDRKEREAIEKMKLSHVRSLRVTGSFKVLHSTLVKFQILRVLDLEGCKDLTYSHIKKICRMLHLKFLSLRQTEVETIPEEISRLQYLEVLDIRETKVRKLPASVERLQRMAHLLAGNKRERIALKLTAGITKMTDLVTLSGVEIDTALPEGKDALRSLESLVNLNKLTIFRLGTFAITDNMLLLSAIEHLCSCTLKFFHIDDDFNGFLDSWFISSQGPPEHLYTLGLCGKLSHVPEWIGYLHNLTKLTLSLTSLTTDTLRLIAELPELFSVIFTLDYSKNNPDVLDILNSNMMKSGGKILVLEGGFRKLKLLCLDAPVLPPLHYLGGSMPELERLEMRFKMVEGIYGLENLSSLQQVFLTISSQAPEVVRAKVAQIKEVAKMSRKINVPSVVVNEYNESRE